jgi:hypothetical protein
MPNALIKLETGDKTNPEPQSFSIESSGELLRFGDALIDCLGEVNFPGWEMKNDDWRVVFSEIFAGFAPEGATIRTGQDFQADMELVVGRVECENEKGPVALWEIQSFSHSKNYQPSDEENEWAESNLGLEPFRLGMQLGKIKAPV